MKGSGKSFRLYGEKFKVGDMITYRLNCSDEEPKVGTIKDIIENENRMYPFVTTVCIKNFHSQNMDNIAVHDTLGSEYIIEAYNPNEGIDKIKETQGILSFNLTRSILTAGDVVLVDMWKDYRLAEFWEGEIKRGVGSSKDDPGYKGYWIQFKKDDRIKSMPNPMYIDRNRIVRIIKGENWVGEFKEKHEDAMDRL